MTGKARGKEEEVCALAIGEAPIGSYREYAIAIDGEAGDSLT